MCGRRGAVAAAGTAAVLALTGCGSDDGDAISSGNAAKGSGDIQREDAAFPELAVDAMRTLESVHVVGKQRWIDEPAQIDLRMDKEGNCAGSVSNDDQGAVELVMRGDEMWFKPDALYMETRLFFNAATIAEIEGSYLLLARADAPPGLGDMCRLHTYAQATDRHVTMNYEMTAGKSTEHKGVPVMPHVDKSATSEGANMMIAAEGKPYPVTLTDPGYLDHDLEFSAFDEPVKVEAPPADSVLTEEQVDDIQYETALR